MRNWDYRYCWLRDSVLALEALLAAGYGDEALAFRDFLLRAGTGDPTTIQIMYGIGGERRLTEFELAGPAGLRGLEARPDRQRRLRAVPARRLRRGRRRPVHRRRGRSAGSTSGLWPRWRAVVEHLETIWRRPDDGIWEARGPRQHFTYSKVMAWVVFDRAVRVAERFGLEAPLERWKQPATRSTRRSARRATTRATHVHPVLRLDGARRQRPQHPAGRLPARHRRARHRHHRRRLARARSRWLRLALLDRRDRRRAARRRGAVPRLLLLAGGGARAERTRRRGSRAVRRLLASPTTSACSQRSTTSPRQRQVGNFPRRSAA